MSENIPFDIQMDIMNTLPVKSLLQFRTVSKQWKFSIDNYGVHENLAFRHMDSNLNIFSLTPFASSEDVWCFAFGENLMLLLWNPSIKKSIGISVPNYTFQPDLPKIIFGFGICSVTLEPTLLKINYPLYSDGPLPVKSLLQFCTVSKQWKFSIDNFDFIHENLAFKHIDSNLNIMSLTPVASSEGRQMLLVGGETENVPLYYHMYDNFQIQFGREEICLVTGLKFGVEYSDDYDDEDKPIHFRQRVFPSCLDGKHITGKNVEDLIKSKSFKKLDDDDAVSLCCIGILQLVLLGLEDRRAVPNWILRLANDRDGWDDYPWGSYVWPTLYYQLRDANVKRWFPLYGTELTNKDDKKLYSIFGFTWEFKKFKLEANYPLNLSARMTSFDDIFDITDDNENNDSRHKNESHFEKPESSFGFGDYNEYEDKQNDFDNVVHENPQPNYHKWEKFMSFKPDIPETPLYKSKPMISKEYKKETEVKVGNIFDNKEALVLAIRMKALDEGYQFLSERSNPNMYYVKCFHFKEWKIRATRWGDTQKFSITFLNDVHTCLKTQTYPNHRNANKKVIAHLLTPKLQDPKRVIKGKDIQQDLLSEYKLNISYQQAWRGKDYAIQQIRGSPFESFEMLPYYCYNLERKNQGTVTRIKTDEKGVFEMLFIAIGASIRTFMHCLRPLLIIDAAHLKGQYKGTNLVAVGMDGNNQIVPIAFGICKGETGPCWSWWMSVLKECIPDSPNLLFISDRHAAIALAVHNEFPLAFHVVCCRHLMMNLSLKKKKTKGLYWKICKAYTPEEFSTKMSNLQAIQPDAYHKLIGVDPQRWSRAHCPLFYRKLPVLKLAETYRAMVQEWYFKRRELADNMTSEITEWVANKAPVNVINGSFPSFLVALRFAVTRLWRYDEIVYQLYQIGFKDDKYQGNY
ncbi:transposase, MuDR, MULE transposase domain protein [Tanacetum coccineum]|uniref:Transposase, MuDR, MULE transposase domain protein n=1 Tax=Tanacetum coccineum TaxID=301880 RepID=A0ABQ5E625_9ASTR